MPPFQMKFCVKCLYFLGLYFTILIYFHIATTAVVEASGGVAVGEQSTSRRIQPSRRTSSNGTGRNTRAYLTNSFYKRVRTRIRYPSTSTSVRNRGKSSVARQTLLRNTTRNSNDGRSPTRYYYQYPASQKSFYNLRTINKQYKFMRLEHRRYAREIERAKTEANQLRQKCNSYERNATSMMLQLERQKKEFQNYQKETMSKIRQIETHQQSQDLQYFEVFEAASNNTAEISQLHSMMDNLHNVYGDIGEMPDPMPTEDNWNQLSAQDIQLRYESFGVDDGTAEEIIERSYQRLTEDIQPQLEEHRNRLDTMQESLQRQNQNLKHTNSAVHEYTSALEGTLADQNDLTTRMNGFNRTLRLFHGDLITTKMRVSRMEEQIIAPPQNYYPENWLDVLESNFGDPISRVKWRSKENLDLIFLMMYIYQYTSSVYYLMMEDDVITLPNYTEKIINEVEKKKNDDWIILSFSSLGSIGKLFRT